MAKGQGVTLLMLLLSLTLNAKSLFNDHLISPKASDLVEQIGEELNSKTGINSYLIATNDKIERGVSVYDYIKKYSSLSKPYYAIVFAPNSMRMHIIASDRDMLKSIDKEKIKEYAIRIIASVDKNSLQSKFDLGLVQAYSELADQIAKNRGVELQSTIKESGRWVINLIEVIVGLGSLIVVWIYFIFPIFNRKKG